MVYGRKAVIPMDVVAATGPSQPKLVGAEDLIKAMMELREDSQCGTSVRTRRPSVNLSPAAEEWACGEVTASIRGAKKVIRQVTELNFELRKSGGKKTLVVHVSQMKKFVVELDEKSDSEEGDEKLERADTDLDVERTDTDLDVERADTGSEEARVKTEACMACAETETGETPEADTGVTPDTNTAAAGVEPPARREKGRMRCRPLELIAEMDEGLQDGKDSAIPAVVESPAARPIRKKRVPVWVKNILFFLVVCVVGQMVQANEIRGKYVATEGAVFHPEGTLALGDSEWVVIYDVPTKRDEQVIKLVATWVDDMARAFDKASTGNFPMEVTPFLEGPLRDLAQSRQERSAGGRSGVETRSEIRRNQAEALAVRRSWAAA
ncbi:hypothetical protein OUZ56_018700 [Daphnia magna]|uniref:Uncharacterized protein n=1 Tax=Daphnia magna TaxID=35525 RepID=A0ABQ9Z9L5_9CRUS|nr:hypothetical protein OUZ56_018700 [Daphnia magna]